MKMSIGKIVLSGLVLAGIAYSDIPGLFVVQEARIADPFTFSAVTGKRFGASGLGWIGDVNNDGFQDVIVGAAKSNKDTGSLQIIKLGADGKQIGLPLDVSSQDSMVANRLSQFSAPDNFGGSVDVIQKFSNVQECAVVVSASTNKAKLWALKICRDGADVSVKGVSVIDSLGSTILQEFGTPKIGEALRTVDTMPGGARVIAVGIPAALNTSTMTGIGAVLLASIDPVTLAWTRLGRFPEGFTSSDPVFSNLAGAASGFGRSVARLSKSGGVLRLAVTSTGDKPLPRVHLVDLDATTYHAISDIAWLPNVGPDTVKNVYSVASADFDHDGQNDLVLGQPQATGKGLLAGVGGFSVALMNSNGTGKAIRQFGNWAGGGGFVGIDSALTEKVYLGIEVLSGDFDGDQQADVVLGAQGSATMSGSIWPLRMKYKPWLHKPADTITLKTDPVSVNLWEYVTGNSLTWSVSEVDPPATGSYSTCSAVNTASGYTLRCTPFTTNGISHWKVTASDNGNIPSTDHFTQDLNFVIKVVDQNLPPVLKNPLPAKIVLLEDHKDTAAMVFSKYFTDPDGFPLRFDLSPLNGSVAKLLNYYQSTDYDTLHLTPLPIHYGLCSLQVAAKDKVGATLLDTVVIEVVHVNHPPQPADDVYEVIESTPTSLAVKTNDVDVDAGDVTTLAIAVAPKHGVALVQGDKILYTPDSFYLGPDSFRYKLSDQSSFNPANVAITVSKTTAPMRIYRALRDTAVDESAGPIVIHTDSLFFSGALRFQISVYEATTDCQGIAKIEHDRVNSRLTVTPIAYQFGRCAISIKESAEAKLTSTMNLVIRPILTPFKFSPDTVHLVVEDGKTLVYPLDTVDLDKDTLEYSSLKTLPSWIQLGRFGLTFQRDASSLETKVLVGVKKKPLPGVTFTDPTDTLVLYAQFTTVSVLRRKIGDGGAFLQLMRGRLDLVGGAMPFQAELLSLDGRQLAAGRAGEGERLEFSTQAMPKFVFLRLTEGSRRTIVPLFLHH